VPGPGKPLGNNACLCCRPIGRAGSSRQGLLELGTNKISSCTARSWIRGHLLGLRATDRNRSRANDSTSSQRRRSSTRRCCSVRATTGGDRRCALEDHVWLGAITFCSRGMAGELIAGEGRSRVRVHWRLARRADGNLWGEGAEGQVWGNPGSPRDAGRGSLRQMAARDARTMSGRATSMSLRVLGSDRRKL
jgi:hypothetical protein